MKSAFGGYHGPTLGPLVRLTRPTDVNDITVLDLKCYQYPMELSEWKEFLKGINATNKVMVLLVDNKIVGFTAYELVEVVDTGDSFVNVTRLGVAPKERRKGYGRLLLKEVEAGARTMQADKISILVPDIHCLPGDPDDVSVFLGKVGYKPSGSIAYEYQRMYGRKVDGYYFVKGLF